MDPRPIGVFDSGLGGLTAVRQLRRVLPGEDIVYFGDTGRVPYGSRGRDTIVQYARQDIRFLLSRDVKFIIAACGTVSSTYPPEEAARLPVPYTGVVGATARAAVDATRNHRIGIIGTAATVRSGSYAAVIRDMLPDVQIFARACPMFVPLVENGYFNDGNPVTKLIIAEYLFNRFHQITAKIRFQLFTMRHQLPARYELTLSFVIHSIIVIPYFIGKITYSIVNNSPLHRYFI